MRSSGSPRLDVVARAQGWRAFAVTINACYLTAAVDRYLEDVRERCTSWYRSVRAWLRDHPEVSTVFVSQHAAAALIVRPGETTFAVRSAGFRRAWRALPKTVKRVVVIRDVPESSNPQFNCIDKAVAAGEQQPGAACVLPRSAVLRWDMAVSTARRLRSRRYASVDLTEFFCDRDTCAAVVGGVVTHSDVDHMTYAYSRTLGPYLLRKVRRVMASW